MITLTAYKWVPPFAQGLARDLRVRWALEEAGLPYREKLLALAERDGPEHRAVQPFGQIPVLEEDGLTLFESGAIVLHIAPRSDALCPSDPGDRARMTQWVFAALNSIEPHVINLFAVEVAQADQDWAKARRSGAEAAVAAKLADLAVRLEGRDYLDGGFTAGDLMMVTVLRILRHSTRVSGHPVLGPYVERCEARPAFRKALADQMAVFAAHAPQPERQPA